ncbi:unnamed protein product [Agarophyton chilense]
MGCVISALTVLWFGLTARISTPIGSFNIEILPSVHYMRANEVRYARALKEKEDNQGSIRCRRQNGAVIYYGPPRNSNVNFRKWQATFADATFVNTYSEKLNTCGTKAYSRQTPPGWYEKSDCDFTRGHLLANSLGGNGRLSKNIVALCRSANQEVMEHWERLIATTRRDKLVLQSSSRWAGVSGPPLIQIQYRVHAMYCQGRQFPSALWLQALVKKRKDDNVSEWFRVLIPNRNDVKAFVYVDESQRLGLGSKNEGDRNNAIIENAPVINEMLIQKHIDHLLYPDFLLSRKKKTTGAYLSYKRLYQNSPCSWSRDPWDQKQ